MPTKSAKRPVAVQEKAPKVSVAKAMDAKAVDAKAVDECGISKLTPEALSLMADFFKVLSEVSRLQIVCSLKTGAKNVTEIIEETELGQANVSKHLKMLTQAGVVAREQRGVCVYYRIANPFLFELCDLVCDALIMQVEQQSQQLQQLSKLRQSR
ncbi:winged helix-turn-helix transcriptional regulator [Leptothermofonsia sichuanensis E412]|uniref:ArsR/SmtB family transcription factor n=1 Tax=Leptothermofonsia sichuanensis TaxID=2917832 RepID=UPI001CA76842|nr:metalloregulator ArsR/SmtB family transcription factor [Leptothermofonsia sichuanensis]QZZ21713.1 winged helix-turn-helix transcriptional regulator [Leptothermofonsia sichuanensis E412]